MLSKRFHLHCALLGSTQFNQISNVSYTDGVRTYRDESSGVPDSVFTYVPKVSPAATFSTTALKRALDEVGFNGVHVTTGATPFSLVFQQANQGGTRKTGSTAMKINFAAGMLVPRKITASQGDAAKVELKTVTHCRAAVLLALIVSAAFIEPAPAIAQERTAEIDQLFSWATPASPGGVVAVSLNGKLIVNRAYGLADLERGVPNTTHTVFDVASVTKQFVATATLILVEEGRLSLTEDVRSCPPVRRGQPHWFKKIRGYHVDFVLCEPET